MSNIKKINELKTQLTEELSKPNPNQEKVNSLRKKIVILGIGITAYDINNIKPF